MKRLCLLGEFKPDVNRINQMKPDDVVPPTSVFANIEKPDGNKNDFIIHIIGQVYQTVEVKNIIEMIKTLFDKYACQRFRCKTVSTRAFVKTTENFVHISQEAGFPLNFRGKIYPPYTSSRLSVKKATCKLLRSSGFNGVSHNALVTLSDAVDELLRDFFDKMKTTQNTVLSKRTRIKNPLHLYDLGFNSMSWHYKDDIIGKSSLEGEETKQLREEYNHMIDADKDCMENGFSIPGMTTTDVLSSEYTENKMSLLDQKVENCYELFPSEMLVEDTSLPFLPTNLSSE